MSQMVKKEKIQRQKKNERVMDCAVWRLEIYLNINFGVGDDLVVVPVSSFEGSRSASAVPSKVRNDHHEAPIHQMARDRQTQWAVSIYFRFLLVQQKKAQQLLYDNSCTQSYTISISLEKINLAN